MTQEMVAFAAQQIAEVVTPVQTKEDMQAAVEGLYWAAEASGETERSEAILIVWQTLESYVDTLVAANQEAIDLVKAAQEVAASLAVQRDEALRATTATTAALVDLVEAFSSGDERHPVVASVLPELVDELATEIEQTYHVASLCIACDIQQWYPMVAHDDLLIFFDLLYGGVLDNGMNTSADEYALQAEIGEFVTKTAAKYREMKGEGYEQPARPCHGGA